MEVSGASNRLQNLFPFDLSESTAIVREGNFDPSMIEEIKKCKYVCTIGKGWDHLKDKVIPIACHFRPISSKEREEAELLPSEDLKIIPLDPNEERSDLEQVLDYLDSTNFGRFMMIFGACENRIEIALTNLYLIMDEKYINRTCIKTEHETIFAIQNTPRKLRIPPLEEYRAINLVPLTEEKCTGVVLKREDSIQTNGCSIWRHNVPIPLIKNKKNTLSVSNGKILAIIQRIFDFKVRTSATKPQQDFPISMIGLLRTVCFRISERRLGNETYEYLLDGKVVQKLYFFSSEFVVDPTRDPSSRFFLLNVIGAATLQIDGKEQTINNRPFELPCDEKSHRVSVIEGKVLLIQHLPN